MSEQLTALQQELAECLEFNDREGPCIAMAQENEKLHAALCASLVYIQALSRVADQGHQLTIISQPGLELTRAEWIAELQRLGILGPGPGHVLANALEALEEQS